MYEYEYPRPALTADIVVFTIRDGERQVLLIRRGEEPFLGSWALPGGFVGIDEEIEAAAARELHEETGVEGVTLEQLHTFGALGRDPRGRTVTVAYIAFASADQHRIRAATDADAVGWFSLDDLPRLAFDHEQIVAMAIAKLDAAGITAPT